MIKLLIICTLAIVANVSYGAQRLPSPTTVVCSDLPSVLGLQDTYTLDSYRTIRIEDGMALDFVALNNYGGMPSEWQLTVKPGKATNWPFGNDIIRICRGNYHQPAQTMMNVLHSHSDCTPCHGNYPGMVYIGGYCTFDVQHYCN